jgi:4-amino-4-deoxy-L-arabinose transferase-like glycosyltransferase
LGSEAEVERLTKAKWVSTERGVFGASLERALERFCAGFERHLDEWWGLYLSLVILVSAALVAVIAGSRPLEHDELFSYYVARQPSLSAVYSALVRHADNHPPIDYWARHISMRWFGPGELAFRLPSVLAFVGCLLGIFAVARRGLGVGAGFVAVAVFLVSQATSTGYYGRQYCLILLWTVMGLWLWRRAADGSHRRVALGLLGVLFATSLCLHFYAPFHVAAVISAEMLRSWRRKAIDWGMWGAFACSLAGLPVVLPLLSYARSFSQGFWTPVTMERALQIYGALFVYGLPAFFATLAAWAVLKLAAPRALGAPANSGSSDFQPELFASLHLLSLPLVVLLVAKLWTHALSPRYAYSFVLGAALLMAFASRHSLVFRLAATLVITSYAIGVLGVKAVASVRNVGHTAVPEVVDTLARRTSLPLVFDSSQTFLVSAHYAAPALRDKLFYPVDPDAALRFGNENTDQIATLGLARIAPFHVMPLDQFLRTHPRFVLVYEGGWLLRRLVEDHPNIKIDYFGRIPFLEVDMRAAESAAR